MWKKLSKKYWKIAAAAAFLSVAGLFYGVFGEKPGGVLLENRSETAEAKREPWSSLWNTIISSTGR